MTNREITVAYSVIIVGLYGLVTVIALCQWLYKRHHAVRYKPSIRFPDGKHRSGAIHSAYFDGREAAATYYAAPVGIREPETWTYANDCALLFMSKLSPVEASAWWDGWTQWEALVKDTHDATA